jgi:hypothetical protein
MRCEDSETLQYQAFLQQLHSYQNRQLDASESRGWRRNELFCANLRGSDLFGLSNGSATDSAAADGTRIHAKGLALFFDKGGWGALSARNCGIMDQRLHGTAPDGQADSPGSHAINWRLAFQWYIKGLKC